MMTHGLLPAPMTFGQKLRLERQRRRLTLAQVAERIDRSESLLSKVENDIALPSLETLTLLNRAYGRRRNHMLLPSAVEIGLPYDADEEEECDTTFGQRLAYVRSRAGIAISSLAQTIETSEEELTGIEAGTHRATVSVILAVLAVIDPDREHIDFPKATEISIDPRRGPAPRPPLKHDATPTHDVAMEDADPSDWPAKAVFGRPAVTPEDLLPRLISIVDDPVAVGPGIIAVVIVEGTASVTIDGTPKRYRAPARAAIDPTKHVTLRRLSRRTLTAILIERHPSP